MKSVRRNHRPGLPGDFRSKNHIIGVKRLFRTGKDLPFISGSNSIHKGFQTIKISAVVMSGQRSLIRSNGDFIHRIVPVGKDPDPGSVTADLPFTAENRGTPLIIKGTPRKSENRCTFILKLHIDHLMIHYIVVTGKNASAVRSAAQGVKDIFFGKGIHHRFNVIIDPVFPETFQIETSGRIRTGLFPGTIQTAVCRIRRSVSFMEIGQSPEGTQFGAFLPHDKTDPVQIMNGFCHKDGRRLLLPVPVTPHIRVCKTPMPHRLQQLYGNDLSNGSVPDHVPQELRISGIAHYVTEGKHHVVLMHRFHDPPAGLRIRSQRFFQKNVIPFPGKSH